MVFVEFKSNLETIIMNVALDLAKRSKDNKYKVGCIITDETMKQWYTGYNGGAKGQSDERGSDNQFQSGLIHAEMSALLCAPYDLPNKKAFVTLSPCEICAKMLVNAKVTEVYYHELYCVKSLDILINAGIKVEKL